MLSLIYGSCKVDLLEETKSVVFRDYKDKEVQKIEGGQIEGVK